MKNISNYFILALILTVLFSCGDKRTGDNAISKPETPAALKDDLFEMKSYGRSGDLTEELYEELIAKNPALKKLEDDLDAFEQKPNDLTGKFNQYDYKSKNYYSSATYKASAISDSLLRMKIIELITASNKQYINETAELTTLLKQIHENSTTLGDHYTVMKIVLTLPVIEKYQKENLPEKEQFRKLKKQQEDLIENIDSLTLDY